MSSFPFCFKRLALARKLLAAILFLILSKSLYSQTPVSGNQNGTWTKVNSPYILTGSVTVPIGQTLTIEPGVVVRMPRRDYRITVNGRLMAQGIGSDSIRFKGEYNSSLSGSSHGGTIYFNNTDPNNISYMRYVSIDSLGDVNNAAPYNVAIRADGFLVFESNRIQNGEGTQVYINYNGVGVRYNNFRHNNANYPAIYLANIAYPGFIRDNSFVGSGVSLSAFPISLTSVLNNTGALIEISGTLTQSSTWPKPGANSRYRLNSVTVNAATTLTIDPGCIILLPFATAFSVNGTLLANGTATDSVYFVGGKQGTNSNYGGCLQFTSSSQNSSLSYVSLDSLGQDNYYNRALWATASVSITNSSIRNFSNYGVYIERSSVAVTQCTFSSRNAVYAVQIAQDSLSPAIQNCSFIGSDNAKTIYGSPSSFSNVVNNINALIYVSGSVTKNSTWPKPGLNSAYKVNSVSVNSGKTLTIEPGCRILLPFATSFAVDGTLLANGTATDSIYFVGGKQGTSYNYGGSLNFSSNSSNSSLSYVSMDSLGQDNYYNRAVWATAPLLIANSSIRNFISYGVYIERSSVMLNQCSFGSQNSYYAIFSAYDSLSPTVRNCSFSGTDNARTIYGSPGSFSNVANDTNAVLLLSGSVIQNSIWHRQGMNSIYKINSASINSGKTLTIEPGCKILLPYGTTFYVNGTLVANGTASDSIYFIGGNQGTNYNYGGSFQFTSSSQNSSLSYASLDSLGYDYNYNRTIWAYGPLSVSNSSIRNFISYGVYVERSSVSVNQCSFSALNSGYSVYVPADTVSPVIQNCLFSGSDNAKTIYGNPGSFSNIVNDTNAVLLLSGSVRQNSTWHKQGVNSVYKINSVSVNSGMTLTLDPGCRILLPFGTTLSIDGTLVANGTAMDSIYFIGGRQGTNYNYGGSIQLTSSSTNSSLRYTSLDSLGQDNYYNRAVWAYGPLSFSNSSIRNFIGYGLYVERSSVTVNQCRFSSQNSAYSVYVPTDTVSPTIQNCLFSGSENAKTIYGSPGNFSNIVNDTNSVLMLNGSVAQNSTWRKQGINSIYKIASVSVNSGKTLTVEPGCKILLPFATSFSVNGTLLANGTSADSIYFIGGKQETSYNYGGYLNFTSSSSNSSLSYVSMDSLGQDNYYNRAVWATAPLSISNSSIRNFTGYGVYIERSSVTINQCKFSSQNSSYAVFSAYDSLSPTVQNCFFYGSDNAKTVYGSPGSFSNVVNDTNAVLILNGNVNQNSIWHKPGMNSVYKVNYVAVNSGKTLTIEPGCRILLPFATSFTVNGTLLANGTAADSIYFVGGKQGTGYTYGGSLNFTSNSANSSLSYAILDSLGQDNYYNRAVWATAPLSISNSSIRNFSNFGVYIERSGVTVNQCSFSSQNSTYAIYSAYDSLSPAIQNCSFSGSDNARTIYCSPGSFLHVTDNTNAILLADGNVVQTALWHKQGANSFYKANSVSINSGKTLTIEPGCGVLLSNYYTVFQVNGTLIANGTSVDSIRFYGTRNNGSYSYGGQFNFGAGSVNSSVRYAVFDSLGYAYNYNALINVSTNSFSMANSSIRNSHSYPFYLTVDTIRPPISNCIFSGATDISKTLYCYPGTIANMSNLSNAILDLNGALVQDATWKKQGAGTVYKASTVTVNGGKTLTIEPGNRIWLPYFYTVFQVNGTLIANGTATDSIRFYGTRNNGSYSHGGQFNFGSGSVNSSLQYVVFDSLGYAYNYSALINTSTNSFSLGNSSVRNSYYYPFYLTVDTVRPSVKDCIFSGTENSRTVYGLPKCFSLIKDNTNTVLRTSGTINTNCVWPRQGANSYYYIDGAVTVNAGNVLTIESPNVINLAYNTSSLLTVNGTLRAQGTETAPVLFTKIAGTGSPGNYGGSVVLAGGSTSHVLSYCTFDKLGAYYGYALGVNTSDASISNLSVSNSTTYGVYVSGASPTVSGANITGNPYGVYVVSGKPVFSSCNIFGNATYGIYNAGGTVSDTVDARNCYWGHPSGPNHPTLNFSGQGNQVSDKVKFNPWKGQPANGQIVDLGIGIISRPGTACNLTATDTVTVKITNYGNITQSGFPVSYQINGGTPVSETVAASILPGASLNYSFMQRANFGAVGSYQVKAYTSAQSDSVATNDTSRISIQHLSGVGAPGNLLPANNADNVDLPVPLNWSAVPDAESYDLYVWKFSLQPPSSPTVAGLTQISYSLSSASLQYGTAYKWKVVAKRSDCLAESVVQAFTTRQLPDLVVDSVFAPATAVSETDIAINFKVKNIGLGSTVTTGWYDVVYISDQPVLGVGNDVYVGQLSNFSALNTGEPYASSNITYHIPQGTQGAFYIIITTNYTGALKEVSDTNNLKVKPISIALAPPPDLQVTNLVVSPSTAFSEDSATISFTVQNLGTGPTTVPSWFDQVYLAKDTTLNVNTATTLSNTLRNQPLPVNGTYTITQRVKLPAQINGTYYVHVFTDRNNNVFEYTKENNNTRRSLPLNIILRPAPNLVIGNFSVAADTVASGQSLNVQWTTRNDGAAIAKPGWYEGVYYSPTATFNAATAVLISGIYRNDSIASLGSSPAQQTIQVPNLPEGTYYFFVKTDAYDQVFESTGENDNISAASGAVRVVNPDLKPVQVIAPASAVSEQTFAVSWTVKNDSRAGIYNSSWADYVYLSQDTLLNGDDISLGYQNLNPFMPAGSDYTRQLNVTLPQAISGNYYLLVNTGNGLYEKTKANNLTYKAITITLAPWPDLQVSTVAAPAMNTIGSALSFQYTVQNTGAGSVPNKSWTDYVYLTSVNNVNTASLTLLGTINQNRTLNSGGSYTQAGNFTIPTSLAAGTYYIVVVTDFTNRIFENTGESNNKTISTGITMASVPPVDLSVTAGQLLNTGLIAGQTASLQYTVKNNSTAATVVPSWTDAVYLSSNPVLDASDVLLSAFTVNGPLNAGATYVQTRSVTIPNGVSGSLYLLVQTDKDNVHTDPNRGNNTLSVNNSSGGQTVVITVPPPADLVIQSITAPAEATAAQPITVGFTIKNTGTGTTPAASWTDNVYLSTDNVLDYSDVQIGSLSHSGTLASGGQYNGTLDMTIPANLSGNYILIVKSDGGNAVYEPNKVNNLAFSPLFIASQAPSDLIVSEVTLPAASQAAGTPLTVNWKLKNVGSNRASGYIKEAVYLSADTLLDPTDVLLGTVDGYVNIPTLGSLDRQLTKPLYGVSAGRYYLLVRTDILNNIIELNDGNNVKASADTLTVTVKQLPLYVLKNDTLPNGVPVYYRIEVPDSLAGETLSVKLTGDSVRNAVNRMYLGYGKIPKPNGYDYAAAVPFQANQEAIVPELKAGTYYLTAYGSDTATALQPASLFAKIIPFGISYVNAAQGGNGGAVTVQINGAKFEPGMTVQLTGVNTINAQAVYYVNSTRLYAAFNLSGATLGSYTVKLTKGTGTTAQLPNGFAVVPASPGGNGLTGGGAFTCSIQNIGYENNIETDVLAPASVRAGSLVKITIAYSNTGNVDIPVPKRMLLSLGGAPVNFAPYFDQNLQQLLLVFGEEDGPPDILRAGASGFIHIYSRAVGTLSFIVTE